MFLAGFEPAIQASELPLSLWDQPVRTHYQAHKYLCIICTYVLVVCGKVDRIICSDWFLCVHWLFKAKHVCELFTSDVTGCPERFIRRFCKNCENRLLASSYPSVLSSVRPLVLPCSSAWNNSPSTGQILTKRGIWAFFSPSICQEN